MGAYAGAKEGGYGYGNGCAVAIDKVVYMWWTYVWWSRLAELELARQTVRGEVFGSRIPGEIRSL